MGSLGKRPFHSAAVVAATATAVALAGLVSGAQTVHAATTTAVDCTADSAALTGALASANDGDTLAIQGTCKGTFEIAHDLTLAGSGGATLDGQAAGTVLRIDPSRTVTISGLTITGGDAPSASGGGIHNFGTLVLVDSTVSGNAASLGGAGGGVSNDAFATLTVTNSTIAGNSASGGGGGISNGFGTVTLNNSTVSGNIASVGGGISNGSIVMTLNNSTVSGNQASIDGGGISNLATLSLNDSTVSGNSAGFRGGGVFASFGSSTNLSRSTVSANSAENGGGVLDDETLTVTNSTISGNSATLNGGGIYKYGALTMTSSTVYGNSAPNGGGLIIVFGAATVMNTIIAGQTTGANCAGTPSDGGYNLEDGTSCGFSTSNNSLPNTAPLLDPAGLNDNGGPTQTIALIAGSQAINAIPTGVNGCGTALTSDQRGVSRPQSTGCDIGAFEVRSTDTTRPVITVPADITVNATTPAGASVTYSVMATDENPAHPAVRCSPPSASVFPIGVTTVNCEATDAAGNAATANFTVTVKGAAEQLADLGNKVKGLGSGTSLADKVKAAQSALARNDVPETCSILRSFTNQVMGQSGKTITARTATLLIADATRIRVVLGC